MADRNNNDRNGRDNLVPVCRFDGDNDRNDGDRRRFHDRSERNLENRHQRQQGNRGYRMDRHRPPSSRRDRHDDNYYGDPRRGGAADKDHDSHYNRDDRFRRDGNRNERYNEDRRRRRGDSFHREPDHGDDIDRREYRHRNRERSESGYHSDEYGDSRGRKNAFDSRDHRRRRSRDHTSDEDDHSDTDDDYNSDSHDRKKDRKRRNKKQPPPKKQKEWPPSFQKDESAYTFDTRSAMFYEPLSDFFYDPKSKLYYGNKKCAYFRYDDQEDPPFVQVQKMTTEQVEEHQTAGISQENVHAATLPAPVSTPKIAIHFRTKKVKSSASTLAARECDNPQQKQQTVSKAKQQQIANIGKWNEKQAELKDKNDATTPSTAPVEASPPQIQKKVRTTVKGEPICIICKKKFPNLAKLRLHEKGSELHKKNLRLLQEKRTAKLAAAGGTKRKMDDSNAKHQDAPNYMDRAEKRRQLHGTDLCAPSMLPQASPSQPTAASEPSTPGADRLDAKNLGHQMLQKMGYRPENQPDSGKQPKTANEHLRKEWDRIEAMAQKSGPRNR